MLTYILSVYTNFTCHNSQVDFYMIFYNALYVNYSTSPISASHVKDNNEMH